ncbi:MAG: hypothetical protein HY917_01340, partial [Candidatus Diapherotrites archaeon]|nr:hypothetical protein [Candidatus Diapherotrites archaeon]
MDESTQNHVRLTIKIITLFALLVGLLFAASYVFKCGVIPFPGWCELYYGTLHASTGGQPEVLIVYGTSGLGDPGRLSFELSNPKGARASVRELEVERISLNLLKQYDLVIVEKARMLSAMQLKMFMDYVNGGGRLVWTGDAGVESPEDDFLREFEDPKGDSNADTAVNPWARKLEGKTIRLDQFLSVQYQRNYCEMQGV